MENNLIKMLHPSQNFEDSYPLYISYFISKFGDNGIYKINLESFIDWLEENNNNGFRFNIEEIKTREEIILITSDRKEVNKVEQ